jgi:hypothetical protein
MSLRDREVTLAERVAPVTTKARVLILDIERAQGKAEVPFWDLGDLKDRRIHPDHVVEWPRTICAAWRWYGQKRTHFTAEWLDGGREAMLRACWDAYHRADIVVGHNIVGFDTKKLKSEWWLLGLKPPSPWRSVDTLKVARREFGLESNTLNALCVRLGIQGKTDRYSVDLANRALAGVKTAQAQLRRYNMGDIDATEGLYEALRGWDGTHPHLGLYDDQERSCSQCGSTDLEADGLTRTALTTYGQYHCRNCGAWSRNNFKRGLTTMRAAR